MNIVSVALRRPVSLVVVVTAVVLAGLLAVHRMARDIFPDLGVPTIYVAQTYGGLDPAQMEGFIVNYYEYHFLYINGIEHIESKSIQGVGLIKLQFHPGTDMSQALAETVSYVDRARAFTPPGTLPPFVLRFDAGSVPVGNLVFSSTTRSVAELQDAALFRIRPMFATLPGVSAPPPFGSSQRTIVISADPEKLRSYNMSPEELVQALSSGNLISPSGNVPIGGLWPMVPVNSVVHDIKELYDVPIRPDGAKTLYLRDVGTVEDAADIQTSYALVDGRRTVYIPVTKRADASTLAVVALVRQNLPRFQAMLPEGIDVSYRFDQSAYVTRAIDGLLVEGGIGAVLTGLMVLLFLRDWRSAVIVVLNIPLAILWASLALWLSGQTVNIMTLGGLALAVGILVDEATVTIENVHVHLAHGDSSAVAARDATVETTTPRFLAMLCILAVFIPAFFMTGAARNLFVPLSLAVGFSMVGSYLLSSTLVPVLAVWLLRAEPRHSADGDRQEDGEHRDEASQHEDTRHQQPHDHHEAPNEAEPRGEARPPLFERFRGRYLAVAAAVVARRRIAVLAYLLVSGLLIVILGRTLGTEVFPVVDTGQFELHLRAPAGTDIDHTEQIALKALDLVKREVGPHNVEISLGFVGSQPPNYAINTIYLWSAGSEEAILQVQLDPNAGIGVEELKETLRRKLPSELPGVRLSFEPSDIVSRVMSFGAPTPIEVTVSGTDMAAIRRYAEKLQRRLAHEPLLRDLQFEQELDFPIVKVDLARDLAGMLGVTAADVSQALTAATSSSRYVVPNYWADSTSGVGYQVQVQIPGPRISSLEEVELVPIVRRDGKHILLRDLAAVTRGHALGEYDRYDSQRTLTLSANLAGEDLGGAAARVRAAIASAEAPPKQVTVTVRGQVEAMEQMFGGLQSGLGVAVGVILLLLTAYFQSLRLSLAVILTIPAVVAGVAVMLALTHTTLNIQSYMGTIMAVGVAVANSILLVTFAERSRMEGHDPAAAALEGAGSRLRPIVMTGAAMIAGTIPMALGLGDGGEQTAPLGRAVIGGLGGALCATLLALPAVFAMLTASSTRASASLDPDDPSSARFAGGDPTSGDGGGPTAGPGPGRGDIDDAHPDGGDSPGADAEVHAPPGAPHPGGGEPLPEVPEHETLAAAAAPQPPQPPRDGAAADPGHGSDDGSDDRSEYDGGDDGGAPAVPATVAEAGGSHDHEVLPVDLVAAIKAGIDLSDRARIDAFGDDAQRTVVGLAGRILTPAQGDVAATRSLLSDILAKVRGIDPAALAPGPVMRLFSSRDARVRRFAQEFGTTAAQIDRITVDLDRHRQRLRSDLARLDALYQETRTAIGVLDAHIAAADEVVDDLRSGALAELQAAAQSPPAGSEAGLAAQTHHDAVTALDRLEKRILHLQGTRRIGMQQLPQIRIAQSGDEALIENLQATTELIIPAWKQKMMLLIGLNRRQSALDLLAAITGARDDMMREASAMMTAHEVAFAARPERTAVPAADGDDGDAVHALPDGDRGQDMPAPEHHLHLRDLGPGDGDMPAADAGEPEQGRSHDSHDAADEVRDRGIADPRGTRDATE